MSGTLDLTEDDAARDIDDLAGGALVNLFGKVGRLSRAIYLWVVAVLFGAEVLGLYTLAWSVAFTVGRVGRFGLQRAMPRYVAAARAAREGGDTAAAPEQAIAMGLWVGLGFSMPLALAVHVLAGRLARFYADPQLAPSIEIMAWTIPALTLATVFVESTRALRIMRYGVYIYSVAGPLVLLLGGLATAALGAGMRGLAWSQLGMSVAMAALSVVYCFRHFSAAAVFRALWAPQPYRDLVRFCFPVMLTDVFYAMLLRLDVFMLGAYLAADDVGVYSAARRLSNILLKVPQSFDPIFSPIISDLTARGHRQRLGDRFVALVRWILTLDLLFVGAMVLGGPDLLALLGDEFTGGAAALMLLTAGAALQGLFAPAELMLIMGGHPGLNLANNLAWLTATFVLNLILIPVAGVVGAATAALGAIVLVNVLRLLAIHRLHGGIHPFRRSQLKPLAAATVAGVLGALLQQAGAPSPWSRVLGLVAFVLVFCLLLWALGLDAEDRALVGRIVARWRRRRAVPASAERCGQQDTTSGR